MTIPITHCDTFRVAPESDRPSSDWPICATQDLYFNYSSGSLVNPDDNRDYAHATLGPGQSSLICDEACYTTTQRDAEEVGDFPVWRLELNSSLQLESFATETIGCDVSWGIYCS